MKKMHYLTLAAAVLLSACTGGGQKKESENSKPMFTGAKGEVKLMTVDPGHFHAALVQKTMYEMVSPEVHIYAPDGPDLKGHLNLIESYNTRTEDPTSWETKIYTGNDYLEKMLEEKPGNVVVLAGNNAKKIDYILSSVKEGLNVLADKPMVITPEGFPKLEEAFEVAKQNGVLLYDIMTERFEITTILQRELSQIPEVFGDLQEGTPEDPAITKESVHHFAKEVSGKPLIRPSWFYDVAQQGEGIVDVTTHLVDMIQWEAFPEQTLSKEDVEIVSARRWTTDLTPEMFKQSTGLDQYPDFLQKDVEDGTLKVYSNGEINYRLKGIHSKVSVIWNFEAPAGTGDTHYSIMRGSKANLIIKQGKEENFVPTLYVETTSDNNSDDFGAQLETAVKEIIDPVYPGISSEKISANMWKIQIPQTYRVGHEAHFGQVTENYLRYLASGDMPEWEIPNMIVKYYTTTEGMRVAME